MKQYNILWIFSDQHRGQAMGCSGDPNAETPNLDALARDGVLFSNAYTVSPLCSPARACLYTGKYIHQHGVNSLHKPPCHALPMLPELLQKQGYDTTHIGKWHLSGGAAPCHYVSPYFRPGWNTWMGWENSNRPFETTYSVGDAPWIKTLPGYQIDSATDLALEQIERLGRQEKPWFLVLSVEPPHDPHVAPREDMEAYVNREIVYRKNVPENWKTSENEKQIKGYYAQIRNLDRNVGRLMEKLRETDQYDHTIVFYFSDHGDFMGSFGLFGKFYAEDESTRIPLIIRHPAMKKKGFSCEELVDTLDITKTTMAFAGCRQDYGFYGEDLSDLVVKGAGSGKGWVLTELDSFLCNDSIDYFHRTLITKDYVYSRGKTERNCRMYDRKSDPWQMKNLLTDPAFHTVARTMDCKLMEILKKLEDPICQTWQ